MEELIKQLEVIKAKQKELKEQEDAIKQSLLETMIAEGIDKQDSDYGSVRIQRRQDKDYGQTIAAAEKELKEAKKLADDLGDYTVTGVKESIVFTPPKDLF
jgi:lipopolysaccharide export LptBFGC system permease protein LptF